MLSAYKLIEENKEGTADIVKKFGAQAVVEASSKTTSLAQVASLGLRVIDYISGFLPCKHDPSKLISGMVMSFDPLGNQEWVCNKKLSVEGFSFI